MLIRQNDISEHDCRIGNKTKNLKRLVERGFLVPDFVAIASDTVQRIDCDFAACSKLCEEIRTTFPKMLYAVRSSALIEDQNQSSLAGQFLTEIKVPPEQLATAINNVIAQSKTILLGESDKFSLIIQEYIDVDIAGVCFTRNPTGQRELIIEHHRGEGGSLVGGKITPERDAFYWNNIPEDYPFNVNIFTDIERSFGFPQDIEWGIKDNKLFILQTRPITTISQDKYAEILFLETALPQISEADFCYAKTQISEVSPRPTPFTFSLLQAIYGTDGPIMNVYRKHHIAYFPQPFLKIIGNELFVDQEKELKTLLPSCSLLNKNYRLRLATIRNLPATFTNILSTIFLKDVDDCCRRLFDSLTSVERTKDFEHALQGFLHDYEVVFETNLLAAKNLKKAEVLLKKESITLADLLSAESLFLNPDQQRLFLFDVEKGLTGNTLEIADEDEFYAPQTTEKIDTGVLDWWRRLPRWKQKLYKNPLTQALLFQKCCEIARIVMIKNLNEVRKSLLELTEFQDKKHVFFQSLDEIRQQKWDEDCCAKRNADYDQYTVFELPTKLTAHLLSHKSVIQGISPGIAEGFVVEADAVSSSQTPRILFTRMLSPTLTKHFADITGIISEKGGLLSHLAIIARERHIPIVVIGDKKDFQSGEYLQIDGSTGEIKKLKK